MTEQRTRTNRTAGPITAGAHAGGQGTAEVSVARTSTRTAHAQAAKVLTTGASVSMVFGIVAYMAHATAVAEEAATLQELQAQQATQLAAQQGGAAPATTLPGSVPMMVVLPDGSIVPASTLMPGAVPTSAVAGAGSTATTPVGGAGTATGGAGGGSAGTTQPDTTTPSGGGVVVTTVPATNPPVTVAPTTTVVVTVAPTTTVSGGSGTSN